MANGVRPARVWHVAGLLASLLTASWAGVIHAEISGTEFDTFSDLPTAASSAGTAWFNRTLPGSDCAKGCAFVLGGNTPNGPTDAIQRHDPETGAMRRMAARLPSPRYLAPAAAVDQYVFMFGGLDPQRGSLTEIVRYQPSTDAVRIMTARLPQAAHYMAAVGIGAKVYLFGGAGASGDLDTIWIYDGLRDEIRTTNARLPGPLRAAAAFALAGRAYVVGGLTGNEPRGAIYEFDPAQERLTTFGSDLPVARHGAAAAADADAGYVIGGYSKNDLLDDVVEVRRPDEISTLDVQAPRALYQAGSVWTGTRILLLGGSDTQQSYAHVYGIATTASGTSSPSPSPTDEDRPDASDPRPGPAFGFPTTDLSSGVGFAFVFLLGAGLAGAAIFVGIRSRTSGEARPGSGAMGGSGLALRVAGLTVRRDGKAVVNAISFQLQVGTLNLLLGRSGSGKSSLLRALVGLIEREGLVQILGPEGKRDPRRGIGFVPQDLQLYEELSAFENVVYFGRQYEIPRSHLRQRAERLLADLGLSGDARSSVEKLSGGQRRRVSIAAALIHEPRLLVLDEPTSGLDFSSRNSLWGVLQNLARSQGVAILASSHFIEDGEHADVVGIMHAGSLVRFGPPHDLIRALPGEGRCADVEFEDLAPADRVRLHGLTPTLVKRGLVLRADYRAVGVRYFAKDPSDALRRLLDEFHRQGLHVRSSRLADLTLEDVFVEATGARPNPEHP